VLAEVVVLSDLAPSSAVAAEAGSAQLGSRSLVYRRKT